MTLLEELPRLLLTKTCLPKALESNIYMQKQGCKYYSYLGWAKAAMNILYLFKVLSFLTVRKLRGPYSLKILVVVIGDFTHVLT